MQGFGTGDGSCRVVTPYIPPKKTKTMQHIKSMNKAKLAHKRYQIGV